MKVERILVVGAGTMGHGIAQVAAQSGYDVALFDVDAKAVERGPRAGSARTSRRASRRAR